MACAKVVTGACGASGCRGAFWTLGTATTRFLRIGIWKGSWFLDRLTRPFSSGFFVSSFLPSAEITCQIAEAGSLSTEGLGLAAFNAAGSAWQTDAIKAVEKKK